jgi:hypothetical protein
MREDTYMLHEIIANGSSTPSTPLSFRPVCRRDMPVFEVKTPASLQTSLTESVLLHSVAWTDSLTAYPVATDLLGRVIWFYKRQGGLYQDRSNLMRPTPKGSMLMTVNAESKTGQLLREIDLAGNTLRETNVARVREQLGARGEDPICSFYRKFMQLPKGHTLALGSMERVLTSVHCAGPVNVLNDAVVDLDEDWQVVWSWNSFKQLDVTRRAIINEVCREPRDGLPHLEQSGSVQ